jgi:hypothetical protein
MEAYKLYFKWPAWFLAIAVIGYAIMSVSFVISLAVSILNMNTADDFMGFMDLPTVGKIGLVAVNIIILSLAWYFIIASGFQNKYYYVINKDGIYNNQANLLKKYLSWENELYYCITKSFIGIYKSTMFPLEGKIVNEKDIKNGYLSIKSKKALKKHRDNKGWIVLATKLLKNNIQMDAIIAMINKSREMD